MLSFQTPARSRPITEIIIPLGFILRSWPTRMSCISARHAVTHFMLSHATSCRLLGKVRRLGGCYGNCRVQPRVYCDGVACRPASKQANEIDARDFFPLNRIQSSQVIKFREHKYYTNIDKSKSKR
jgi:hypothetical protein